MFGGIYYDELIITNIISTNSVVYFHDCNDKNNIQNLQKKFE